MTVTQEASRLRKALLEIRGELHAALVQTIPSDDQIIMDHVRAADKIAQNALDWPKRAYGEWCRKPEACAGKGYCPLDPTCGD